MWYRAGLIGLVALSSACGAFRAPSSPAPSGDKIPVTIDNQNFSDMNIYVLRNGSRWLVGHANGLAKTTLTISNLARGDGQVRLLASPIGGFGRIVTPTLIVPRGQSIYFTIGFDPAMSSASAG
jgi:hypothetical protein